ncbi:hypothetical protein ACVRW4_02315 [Streptococcus phocae subsp. phocae]
MVYFWGLNEQTCVSLYYQLVDEELSSYNYCLNTYHVTKSNQGRTTFSYCFKDTLAKENNLLDYLRPTVSLEYFLKLVQLVRAVIAYAHKLLRIIYKVLSINLLYDKTKALGLRQSF